MDRDAHPRNSKNREHSRNSQIKQDGVDIGNINVTLSIRDNQCSAGVSDFLEHSQNSLLNGEPKVDTGDVNVSFSVCDSQCLTAASEFREVSSNSWVESECSQGTHNKQSTKSVCISEPSKFSRDSLGGVGSNVSIKPDMPINVYTQFCLNTAKSKFSLVSLVADW